MASIFNPKTGRTELAGEGHWLNVEFDNDTVTGTFLNQVCKHTFDSPCRVIQTSPGDRVATGIVVSGAGTSGKAKVAVIGTVPCDFDGPTIAHDYASAQPHTPHY